MNYTTAIFLVNDDALAVHVSYELEPDGKTGKGPWEIFKSMDRSLEVGDYVAVPTATRHCRTVVRVEAVKPGNTVDLASPTPLKWIIGRVDEAAYDEIVKMEAAAIDKIKSAEARAAREELRAKLLADNPDISALADLNTKALPAE